MANELPVGGVTIDQVQPQYRQWFIDAARQYNVPLTFLLNIYGAESSLGTNIANSSIARGIMQIGDSTAQRYGINNRDPQSSIFGAARLFGQYIDTYRDPYLAAMAYNWGEGDPNNPSPTRGLLAYQTRGWGAVPEETLRYVDNVMRGVGPSPVGLRDEIARRLYGMPEAGDRIFDVPLPPPRQYDPNEDWHGDTGQEIGPRTGIPETPGLGNAPLPYAGGGLEGRTLQDWISDPTGGQRVAGLSERAGYSLTPEVLRTLGAIEPGLGTGPEGFTDTTFPWFTPGRITQEEGAFLQHHAFMPNNLVFDPEALNWRVPDPQRGDQQRFPGATGIWGAQTVADWLPSAPAGFGQDYLRHLGYGQPQQSAYTNPNVSTFGVPSSGVLGNWFGQTPGIDMTGMGNQGLGDIADMSTYDHQPFDYTQWFGALGTGGATNPATSIPAATQPTWAQDLATLYGMLPGTPGYGAALNPIFGGMYYSQVPSAADLAHQQLQAQVAAQQAAFTANQVAANNYQSQNLWNTGNTSFNPVSGQSTNIWNPNAGVNSLTGAFN